MGVVRITWQKSGEAGIKYLTSGQGCANHDPTGYYLKGAEHGPQAVWLGSAVERLGFEQGQAVTTEDAVIVLAHGCDPGDFKSLMAQAEETIKEQGLNNDEAEDLRRAVVDQARLGRAPYQFKTAEEKLDAWVRGETRRSGGVAPEPERVAAQKAKFDAAKPREARPYVDMTFSAQKSVSVYHAALLASGRVEDADKLMAAFHAAIDDALKYAEKEAGYSRAGRHSGGGKDNPSTGLYVDTGGFVAARWDHHTSREGDPQLHAHVTIRNNTPWLNPKTMQVEWLALDGKALHDAQRGIAATFERSLEERVTQTMLAEFKLRPDGKGREIVGISQEMLDAFSTRRGQVTAKLAEYVEAYKATHDGAEPSPYLLTRMAETATLNTRNPKEEGVSLEEMVHRWEADAQTRVGEDLQSALTSIEAEATAIRIEQQAIGSRGMTAWDLDRDPQLRAEVINAAVAKVQSAQASFTRDDVMFALQKELPLLGMNGEASAPFFESLANEALASQEIVQTKGFQLFAPPEELTRAKDGRNIYRPHYGQRYSTKEHLSREELLVARGRDTEAGARVDGAVVDAHIEQAGLVAGQADAVRGVLTDGRAVSVVVGPAGTGKTTVTKQMRAGWEQGVGGRVLGITPSAVSAKELADAGISGAMNSTAWLNALERGDLAQMPKAGDLLVVDEAGMMSTDHLHQIVEAAHARGAKVVMIGDPEQLSAVGAGGAFRLMTQDREVGAYQLDEVYRFRDANGLVRQWEADASLALRVGDVSAVEQYARRGRVDGGTAEEVVKKLADNYLIDVADHRSAVVLTGNNEQAEAVARAVRERLVATKRVEADGVLIWGEQQLAGKGDLVQARRNDYTRVDDAGEPVLNRYAYKVTERHDDGSLTVRRWLGYDKATGDDRFGGTVRLDAAYLQQDVVLAYSGTVHSAQGRTVQRGYVLLDEQSTRSLVYVGMTRGWEMNTAYAISRVEASGPEQPNDLQIEPTALMREAIERGTTEVSATEELREAREWVVSGTPNAAEWSLIAETHTNDRGDALMRRLLSPENYQRLQAEEPESVYRAARGAELRGHDFEAVLREAVLSRELDTAETVAGTITWRMEQRVLPGRTPEGVLATDWASRTPQIEGRIGEYAGWVADVLDERQAVLGSRAAAEPPEWALDRLGPVPDDAAERLEWERRAGAVQMYREVYGAPDDRSLIGRPPSEGAVIQHGAWEAAFDALGPSEVERRLAGMSDRELTDAVATWQRYREWAPRYVAEEMRTTSLAEADLRRNAELALEDARLAPTAEARERAEGYAAGLASLADEQAHRMEALEEIQGARDLYWERTEPVREAADAAYDELARRGIDPAAATTAAVKPTTAPAAEVEDERQTEAEREQELDQEQEQLLEEEIEAEPEADREQEAEEREPEKDRDQEREPEPEPQPEKPRELDLDAELDRAREAVLRLAIEDVPEMPEGIEYEAVEVEGVELEASEVEQAEPELVEAEHGASKSEMLEMMQGELTQELDLEMGMELE